MKSKAQEKVHSRAPRAMRDVHVISQYQPVEQQTYYHQPSDHKNRDPSTNSAIPSALLKSMPTAYVGLIFILLTWRSLGSYELAGQFGNSPLRLLCIVPSILLLVLNLVGFLTNLTKPMNFKTVLKTILALNIIREWIEMAYNIVKMVTTRVVPREVYFGRFFMNCWWSGVIMSYSKSRWILLKAVQQPQQPPPDQYPSSSPSSSYSNNG